MRKWVSGVIGYDCFIASAKRLDYLGQKRDRDSSALTLLIWSKSLASVGTTTLRNLPMQSKAAAQFALILATTGLRAEAQGIDAGRLTLQRIFASRDFVGQRFGPARWLASGDAYTTIELAVGGGAANLRYDAATGARSVVVPAAPLAPSGASEPIYVEDHTRSADCQALLVFTNSPRVWRGETARDLCGVFLRTVRV